MVAAILLAFGLPAAAFTLGLISGRIHRARIYQRCSREALREMREGR